MPDTSTLLSQVTLAGFVVYGLQWLKQVGWFPWLSEHTKGLNRVASVFGAAFATAGVAWTYSGATLTITGLTLASVATALWHVAQQFTIQQVIYDGAAAREPTATAVAKALIVEATTEPVKGQP